MLKILHLINGEHYAGAERVQDLLGLHLSHYGYQPGFACLKRGKYIEMRQSKDTPLFSLPMRFHGDFSPVLKLATIIRNENYQLIHTHGPRTALIGRLVTILVQRPMVHHVHSPTSQCTERGLRNFVTTKLERATLARASKLIAVSQSVADYLLNEGFQAHKVRVVHNGVPSRPPLLAAKPPPEGRWTIGTIALFRPRKGIENLLIAIANLKNPEIPICLRLVGPFETASYQRQIKALAKKLHIQDQLVWKGFTNDIAGEFEQMDLFVLPSLYGEGLPMVVLEAMAAGVPVVATRVQGIPEVIRHGETGILAEPKDSGSLTEALQSIITGQHDWSAIRAASATRQQKEFSVDNMASEVARVYDEILH